MAALEGFTVGDATPTTATPGGSSAVAPNALKGFSIGDTPSTSSSPSSGFTPLSTAGANPLPTPAPAIPAAKPVDTSKMFSSFSSGIPASLNTETSTPVVPGAPASKNLPDDSIDLPRNPVSAVVNTPITAAANLLSNTNFIKESAAGIDAGDVGGNTGLGVLQKLSLGLQTFSGLTGGIYEMPEGTKNTNPDLLDKGISAISQGLGMAVSIGGLGKGIVSSVGGGAVEALTNLASKYPLTAKYITPFVKPLLENAAGFAAYGQLDPKLGTNIQARTARLATDIGTAPIYTALGMIKSSGISSPASFILGFTMAKLSGASNQNALASGAAFAFLDAAGRSSGTRGLTADEMTAKARDEAFKVLQPYAKGTLNADSSPADLKAVYFKAAHETHPDLGGTAEAFTRVQSAYDLLSKGAVSNAPKNETPAEQSVKLLSGEVKKVVDTHGENVAKQALQQNLGVDEGTADRLVVGSKNLSTPKDLAAAHEKAMATVTQMSSNNDKDVISLEEAGKRLTGQEQKDLEAKNTSINDKYGAQTVSSEPFLGDTTDLNKITQLAHDYGTQANHIAGKGEFIGDFNDRGVAARKAAEIVEGGKGYIRTGKTSGTGNANKRVSSAKTEGKEVAPKIRLNNTIARELRSVLGEVRSDPGLSVDWKSLEQKIQKSNAFSITPGEAKELKGELENIIDKDREEFPANARAAQATLNLLKKIASSNQPGFVAPGKIAEDVAKGIQDLKDIVEHHQEVSDIVGNISNSLYKEEGANKVFKTRLTQLVNEARKGSTPAERTNVYHYMENSTETYLPNPKTGIYEYMPMVLTDRERNYVLPLIEEMDRTLTNLRAKAREEGIYITGDILGEMTPRNAMEKGGIIDKGLDAYREGKRIIQNGGKLTTSVGSGSKHRVYHAIIDEEGNRTVVAIKDGKVTAIKNGVATELGTTDSVIQPKVKEFFDESVMTKLNTLAKELGVTHERVATGATEGLGGNRAGVSFGGRDLIKTRLGPTSVLAHELGHQIDAKYGLQEVMKNSDQGNIIQKELRALADKTYEGKDVTPSFKKYTHKGTEKMAIMFEAYVANRNLFKETAPHLYDDFRDFLAAHAELKPFLDIQPSITLGMQKHGGNLVSGIAGKEFVDKNGKSYIIGQATTREIKANTNTRYYEDPLANYALAIERTARAVRATELLNKIKESPEFKEAIIKEGEGDIPKGFKTTQMQQFRGYWMEPRLAEALDDMARRQTGGVHVPIYDEVNNLLISALVINPVMHFPNVAMGWSAATAAAGVVPETDFMDTFKQVINKDPEYLTWIEHGAPMQYLRQTNAEFADAILADVKEDIQKDPTRYEEIAKALGYANPIEWAHGLEKFSSDATWVANDVMLFNALKTFQKTNNVSYEKAIEEVTKRMSDYRIPPRVLGSRALSLVMQNNAFFMFMRYHYSGVIKPWIESTKDSFTGDTDQKWAGARTLAFFAAMYFLYQLADQGLKKMTGNDNTYMSMAGPMKLAQNVQKSVELGSPIPLIAGTFSLTPSVRIAGAVLTGYDFSNFFKPVYGPGGEGPLAMLKNQAAPYNAVEGAFTGVNSWTDFALAQSGVYSPKSTTEQSLLNGMLNLEKPQVEAAMKAKIAAGDTAGGQALAHEFNTRLKEAIKTADISNGNSGSQARVDYFFQTYPNGLGQKGYAVRIPTAKAMLSYEAKQGLLPEQRILPGAGNQKTLKGQPSDINNHTNPGTVARIVNGVTIYNRMTNESAVKAQLSGGKIQPNTQLDHVVPLEGGGSNIVDNLMVIPTAMDNVNQQVEDFIGSEIKIGRMSGAQAREIAIRYKAGLGEPLPDALMSEYVNKYKSQPLNVAQIQDYEHTTAK